MTESSYLSLMKKRIADGSAGSSKAVKLCLDVNTYNERRTVWEDAKKESQAARIRHAAVKAQRENGNASTGKLNAEDPIKIAAKEMDAAEKAAAKAKAALQETFITVHIKGLGKPELIAIGIETDGDNDAWTRVVLNRALLKVEDHKGGLVPDITADVLTDFISTAPAGDWTKLANTIDEASAGVDFPM